jgi:hypothetical protein
MRVSRLALGPNALEKESCRGTEQREGALDSVITLSFVDRSPIRRGGAAPAINAVLRHLPASGRILADAQIRAGAYAFTVSPCREASSLPNPSMGSSMPRARRGYQKSAADPATTGFPSASSIS